MSAIGPDLGEHGPPHQDGAVNEGALKEQVPTQRRRPRRQTRHGQGAVCRVYDYCLSTHGTHVGVTLEELYLPRETAGKPYVVRVLPGDEFSLREL